MNGSRMAPKRANFGAEGEQDPFSNPLTRVAVILAATFAGIFLVAPVLVSLIYRFFPNLEGNMFFMGAMSLAIYGGIGAIGLSFIKDEIIGLQNIFSPRMFFKGIGYGIIAFGVTQIVTIPFHLFFKDSGTTRSETTEMLYGGLTNPVSAIGVIFVAVLAAPIGEEVMFRLFGISLLKTIMSPIWAIFATSFLFSLAHWQFTGNLKNDLLVALTPLLFGAFNGWLLIKTQSISTSIGSHMGYNGVIMLAGVLSQLSASGAI